MKKKLTALIMILAILVSVCMPAAAADPVPKKVTKAAEHCISTNGRCIVVDNTNSKVYLLKKCKGKWEVKKIYRCTVGDYIDPGQHYFLLRNKSTDRYIYKEDGKTYQYGVRIDRSESPLPRALYFHSYGEKNGKTYKSVRHNPSGIGLCIDHAAYIYRYYSDGTGVMGVN